MNIVTVAAAVFIFVNQTVSADTPDSVQTGNNPDTLSASMPVSVSDQRSAPSPGDTARIAPDTSLNKGTPSNDFYHEIATATEIPPGILFGRFTNEDGPLLITGNVVVPSGQILEFEPGCHVFIGGKYTTITVFGTLKAKGTAAAPVLFQSAREHPSPWDWDRIYCRSRSRSSFEHCIIRHSNYGIYVENGSVQIKNSLFERNSIHAITIKNADLHIENSKIKRGHVCAVFCQEGANFTADSIMIENNITAIACDTKSYCKLNRGFIRGNKNGVAVRSGSSVNIVAVDITKNLIGIVSEQDIPRSMREIVFKNSTDMKIVSSDEMNELLKMPEEVKSIVLPQTSSTPFQTDSGFTPGFSALRAPREAAASFIGNISMGFKFFHPTSLRHPREKDDTVVDTLFDTLITATDTVIDTTYIQPDTLVINHQTKYIGEHSESWYSKLQPEIVIFAQGKSGLLDVNINSDFYINDWLDRYIRANLLTISMNYDDQRIVIGDFFENISETSISGRKLRGIKYTGDFWRMGRGTKRIAFKLAAGQSEQMKDIGDHEPDIICDTVDSGFSRRQQLTYVVNLSVKPTPILTIGTRAIIARDQHEKSFIAHKVSDPKVAAPISAQTGCIDANVALLDGKMSVSAEFDLGSHDTIDSEEVGDIAWYKPQIFKAMRNVFRLMHPESSNYAFATDISGSVQGFDLRATFTEIAQNYYSAGSPFLEADRRTTLITAEKPISDKFTTKGHYQFNQSSVSYTIENDGESPSFTNTLFLNGEYSFGDSLPSLSANYNIDFKSKRDNGSYSAFDTTVVDPDSIVITAVTKEKEYDYRQIDQSLGITVKQRPNQIMDYTVTYQLMRKNDFSDYPDITENDKYDSWENSVNSSYTFNVKSLIRNKISFRTKYKTETDENEKKIDIKISDDIRINIIPRKVRLTITGDYRWVRKKYSDSDAGVRITEIAKQMTIQPELKYSINSRLSATMMGKYEKGYDEAEGSTENYSVIIGGLHFTYLF